MQDIIASFQTMAKAADELVSAFKQIGAGLDEVIAFFNKSLQEDIDNLTPLRRGMYHVLRCFGWCAYDALALIERRAPRML